MIIPILIIAFILRIINLNQSLWWDEAINVVFSHSLSLGDYVTRYSIADFHPPGYFIILWVWGHIFGFSEISVRMPSVFFGVLTVYLTYLIGKDLFSKKVGVIAAGFMSLAPLHIYYSQEARMYSFAAFTAALSVYYLNRFLNRQKYGLVGYAIATSLLLYSDYVAYFILPVQLLFVLVFYKKHLLRYLLATLLGSVVLIPWLVIFPQQLINGQQTANIVSGWQEVVGGASVKNIGVLIAKLLVGRISLDDKKIYLASLFLIVIPYSASLIGLIKVKFNKFGLLLFWLVFPPILALVVSFYIPVFSYFRFLFILPAFYLLLALGLDKMSKKLMILIMGAILLVEIIPSLTYLLNDTFHREDWKGASSFLKANLNSQSMVLFEYDNIPSPYMYYSGSNTNAIAAFKKIPALSEIDLNDLPKNLQGRKKIYVFEYLKDIIDPQRLLPVALESLNYKLNQTYNFRGVGFVYLYEIK